MADWRVFIAETLTGQIMADVTPSAEPTFTRKINDKGALGVRVYVGTDPNARVDFHTYTRPGKYSWALAYGSYIVQAGPVWTYKYTEQSRELEVTCGGLYSLFSRRVTRNPTGHTAIVDPSEDLTYNNLSLRGIMRQLVADNLAQVYYGIPSLILPATETGTATRTYYGYELKSIADNMNDLSGVINGPEFDFAPQFSADGSKIEWRLDIGDPLLGDQESAAVWDYGTEQAPVDTIDVDVDGSAAPCSRVWVKGTGNERALLTGFAEDLTWQQEGYPATDYVDGDHTSASVQQTLEDYADADLAEFSTPTEKWSCTVRITGGAAVEYAPALGNWSLGDAPTFFVANHPWLPGGPYRRRVLGFSNAGPATVDLELSEESESGAP